MVWCKNLERKLSLTRRVKDDNKPIEELCRALLSSRGDVSGMTLAQLILDRYASFDEASKLSWFLLLANDMDVPAETAIAACSTMQKQQKRPSGWNG